MKTYTRRLAASLLTVLLWAAIPARAGFQSKRPAKAPSAPLRLDLKTPNAIAGPLSPLLSLPQTAVSVKKLAENSPLRVITVGRDSLEAPEAIPFRDEEDLRGKTFILIGGNNMGRLHNLLEPARVAKQLGLRLVVVDEADNRPPKDVVSDENFIAAPIRSHDEAVMFQTAKDVASKVSARYGEVAAVYPILSSFVETGAAIRDEVRKSNPAILGDSYDSVHAANAKHLARLRLNENAPDVSVPSEEIRNSKEARLAFLKITKGLPGRRVVVKPITSAGKIGIRINVSSADEAAKAFESVSRDLASSVKRLGKLASLHSVDTNRGVMMEMQLELNGKPGPEVDVEMIRDISGGGLGFVVGNPRPMAPYQQEKGFTLPSPLSDFYHDGFLRAARQALDAVPLRHGNFHTEMMWTDDGPRVLEFNPRMGGGNLFFLAQKIFGINLIEQGMRAMLGLPVIAPSPEMRYPVLLSRYMLPKYGGKVISVSGMKELEGQPGVLEVHQNKKAGDRILHPRQGYADDDFGLALFTGADYAEARAHMLKGLGGVDIEIKSKNGRVVKQNGAYSQGEIEEFEEDPSSVKNKR